MKIWVLTVLFVLNFTSIRGAKMPRENILGLHFDMLKREANLVLGRRQAIFEVMGNDSAPRFTARVPLPGGGGGAELWSLEDGHVSELEMRPLVVQDRWTARPSGGRPLRYRFLAPMVLQDVPPLSLENTASQGRR
jgi:hypothetical protein